MGLFKGIKDWFFPKEYLEYRDSVASLVEYLPVGDLEVLLLWAKKWIPYRSDTDTGNADGKYDPLQNYNGADLTIKAKGGDCDSIAAVFSEAIRQWKNWEGWHICMVYRNNTAHDVCCFNGPQGRGWIDGKVYYGGYDAMKDFYDSLGWHIVAWWEANDLGQQVKNV